MSSQADYIALATTIAKQSIMKGSAIKSKITLIWATMREDPSITVIKFSIDSKAIFALCWLSELMLILRVMHSR